MTLVRCISDVNVTVDCGSQTLLCVCVCVCVGPERVCVRSGQWSPLMTAAGWRTGTSGEQPLGFTIQCCVAVNQNGNAKTV